MKYKKFAEAMNAALTAIDVDNECDNSSAMVEVINHLISKRIEGELHPVLTVKAIGYCNHLNEDPYELVFGATSVSAQIGRAEPRWLETYRQLMYLEEYEDGIG